MTKVMLKLSVFLLLTIYYIHSSAQDIESFSKDITALATESTLESRCNGNIFIFTPECADHISYLTFYLSNWAPPLILIDYERSFKSLSRTEIDKWQYYLEWKGPCSLIFICDLSQSSNTSMGFLEYPKLIRHFDQVLYFSDFDFDFDNRFGWRILAAERSILKYTEILLAIRVVTRNKESESVMRISSVCTYCKNNTDSIYDNDILGKWQRNVTDLANFFRVFDFQREASFHNFRFKIGYLNYNPHFNCHEHKKSNRSRAVRICSGIEWEMLKKLSQSLEFTFELYNFTTEGHGIAYDHGNITGMISALKNDSIDLALGGVSVTPERSQVIDFTQIFAHEPIVFVVEKRNDIYILGIWLAFQPNVWPIIILTLICISILFKLIMKKSFDLPLTYGFQFSISSLLGQPLSHPFMTRKARLLMKSIIAVWWFVCITIGTLYNTSLITSLINPVAPKVPESLHDLLEFDYKFVMGCKQGVVYELLQHGQEDQLIGNNVAFKLIRERLVPFEQEKGGGMIATAYVMEESAVKEIDWRRLYGFRNIQIIKERLFLTGYAWAIRSEAPYKSKIDTALGNLASSGLIQYWYSSNNHREKEPSDRKFKLRKKLGQIHLNLEILIGAFIFFLFGCTMAGFVFIGEILHKHYTFRFFTFEEIKRFCNKWMVKLDFEREIIRVGQQSLVFVAPLDLQSELIPNTKTSGPRRHPELIYLK